MTVNFICDVKKVKTIQKKTKEYDELKDYLTYLQS